MKMPTEIVAESLPVSAARAGEARAWDVLFRRYQLPLFTYVHELVRDEQVSLDIVQDTFVNAVRHIASLREERRFGSWLFGIAHQKCVQHWRRRRVRDLCDGEPPEDFPDPADDPADWLVRQEQEEELMHLVAELPPSQRAVFLLQALEELSVEEIAVIVGAPVGTVKSRLHYARLALRQRLEVTS